MKVLPNSWTLAGGFKGLAIGLSWVLSAGLSAQCVVTADLQTAVATHPNNFCQDPTYLGYTYQTVTIGVQCWFAENLRVDQFRNGDASQMKSSPTDLPSWDGKNSSGFNGLTRGWQTPWNGNYASYDTYGYCWSSTYWEDGAMYRRLSSNLSKVHRENDSERAGMAIRCLKD